MKKYKSHIIIIVLVLVLLLFTSCKAKTLHVPVETIKTEYRESILRDSVHLHDSIIIKMKADTVFFEKYKTIYKNVVLRDSIYKVDSVQVPYPVVEYKEVNKLSTFQGFQIWCGRILLIVLMGYFIFIGIRKKFNL